MVNYRFYFPKMCWVFLELLQPVGWMGGDLEQIIVFKISGIPALPLPLSLVTNINSKHMLKVTNLDA